METEKIKCLVAVTALMLCSVGNAHAADRFESLINSFQVLCTLEAPVFEWIDQKAMAMNLAVRIHDLQHAAVSNRKVRPRYAYLSPFLKQSKTVAWDYLRSAMAPLRRLGATVHESELRVDYPKGGQVRLYGADNAELRLLSPHRLSAARRGVMERPALHSKN
jgi:hypothetical protein